MGLVAYVSVGGDLFSVQGGNYKLMESALRQAKNIYDSSPCRTYSLSSPQIQRYQKQITTVISHDNTMELFGLGANSQQESSLGEFDIVILAAPLQQSRVKFFIRSQMDSLVLHPMPLGGINNNHASSLSHVKSNEHGALTFANPLPRSATTPYTSVVTTIVSNATLNFTHFGLDENADLLPRSILVSDRGKLLEGVTTLTILSVEKGLIKSFSTEELSIDKRNAIFGSNHVVEYVQKWGGGKAEQYGEYGGATPSFYGGRNSESLPYILYDAAKHWEKSSIDGDGRVVGPALYYSNAIESAVAAVEISAIGAKSTAKLVARRLGLLTPRKGSAHDEL